MVNISDYPSYRGFPQANSPGPSDSVYNNGETGYVTANSPQPNTFPAIPINRVRFFIEY